MFDRRVGFQAGGLSSLPASYTGTTISHPEVGGCWSPDLCLSVYHRSPTGSPDYAQGAF
jgi:hypothetical protein